MGPTKAMALNITYSAWSILISIFILGTSLSVGLIISCLLIVMGAVLTVSDSQEFRKKKYRGEAA